jgi:excisionase family DNA binding protein
MSLDDLLSFRHATSRAKWHKEIFRPQPPPFLGPLITVQESADALNRSVSYVRHQIDEGRLNIWKDPTTKRVWVLKDDVDILKGDIRALEERGETRGGKRGPRKPRELQPNEESEDLDAIGGWEHPKPPPVVPGAAIEESVRESQLRYEQKQRENEEWYAAELAKLEDRDPEEAVRQLQLERGWITPTPEESEINPSDLDSAYDAAKALATARPASRKSKRGPATVVRPISYSDPNRRPPKPVEPYVDPDLAPPSFDDLIIPPFPIGWVGHIEAAAMLQVSVHHFPKLVRSHNLQRRRAPTGRRRYLYDTVEIEALAEQRLDVRRFSGPGKRLDWWGSRRVKMELTDFNYWITPAEAAALLGVNHRLITEYCDRGLLPCYQEKPGVMGSRLYVPHNHVIQMLRRKEQATAQRAMPESPAFHVDGIAHRRHNEQLDIDEFPERGESKVCKRNHGEYYSTRQVANLLGVSKPTVLCLMRRGRLTGHRLNKKPTAYRPWWFFKRADVDALLADPQYNRNHKRWLATVRRKAGWED